MSDNLNPLTDVFERVLALVDARGQVKGTGKDTTLTGYFEVCTF